MRVLGTTKLQDMFLLLEWLDKLDRNMKKKEYTGSRLKTATLLAKLVYDKVKALDTQIKKTGY